MLTWQRRQRLRDHLHIEALIDIVDGVCCHVGFDSPIHYCVGVRLFEALPVYLTCLLKSLTFTGALEMLLIAMVRKMRYCMRTEELHWRWMITRAHNLLSVNVTDGNM